MSNSSTLDELKSMAAADLGIDRDTLRPETTFADMGLDSLMLVDFMFGVEDHYQIRIDHDEALKQPTLAGLAALVDREVASDLERVNARAQQRAADALARPLAAGVQSAGLHD